MKKIFETWKIGKLPVKNRVIRSATLEMGAGKDGEMTSLYEDIYQDLAEGEIGLIITGMMGIGPNAGLNKDMVKIHNTGFVSQLKKLTDLVHKYDTKLIVQLGHTGVKAGDIQWGDVAFGPSEYKKAREMTKDEIHNLIPFYGEAALLCKEGGADGVQIHGAHGYLVSEFLSPFFNKREDEYGGSIENRSRFLFEIYEEIRSKVGEDYPILIKINYSDLIEGGIPEEDVLWVCRQLDTMGIDAIEVSSGISISKESASTQMKPALKEGIFLEGAKKVAKAVSCPVISVCGYRSLAFMEEVISQGIIDGISLCRPLIREPNLIKRWLEGDTRDATCISCNKCFTMEKHGCIFNVKGQ